MTDDTTKIGTTGRDGTTDPLQPIRLAATPYRPIVLPPSPPASPVPAVPASQNPPSPFPAPSPEQARPAPPPPVIPSVPSSPPMPPAPPAPPQNAQSFGQPRFSINLAGPAPIAPLPPLPAPIYRPSQPPLGTLPAQPAVQMQPPAPPPASVAPSPAPVASPSSLQAPLTSPYIPPIPSKQAFASDSILKDNITKILNEVKIPERREAGSATEHPTLGETPLTETAYRATTQLDATPRTLDAGAIELANEQNKIALETSARLQSVGRSSVVSLHTMKTDLQDVVREDKISVIRAASMEADKHPERQSEFNKSAKPSRWRPMLLILTATIVLLALGGAALFAIYYLKTTKPVGQAVAPIGLLFAEQQIALPIDNQSPSSVKQNIVSIMNGQASAGAIIEIIPIVKGQEAEAREHRATLAEFLRALGTRPPEELVRALSDEFFFGVHMADVPSPVFVLPVDSYDHAFAGMLLWEKNMNAELAGPFMRLSPYKPTHFPTEVATTTATTTTAVPDELLPPRTFEDLVMRNYDVRALKDDSGSIVLYYSFPTQNLLIISASPYSFPEVLSRLQAARKL